MKLRLLFILTCLITAIGCARPAPPAPMQDATVEASASSVASASVSAIPSMFVTPTLPPTHFGAPGPYIPPPGASGTVLFSSGPTSALTWTASSSLPVVTWANDLSTSTNTHQYVGSISGPSGTGGAVPLLSGARIRGANGAVIIAFRNQLNTGDITALSSDSSNDILLDSGGNVIVGATAPNGVVLAGASTSTAVQGPLALNNASVQWGASVLAPSISQGQQVNASAPANMALAPQAPGAACTTGANCTPGSLLINLALPGATGSPSEPVLQINRNGVFQGMLGTIPAFAGNYAGHWLGPGLVPSSTNYTLLSSTSQTFLNGVSGLSFAIGGTIQLGLTPATFAWSSTTALPAFTQTAQASTSTGSGANGQAFLVSAQSGQPATGAAHNGGLGGVLQLESGAGGTSGSATGGNGGDEQFILGPGAGTGTPGSFVFQENATPILTIAKTNGTNGVAGFTTIASHNSNGLYFQAVASGSLYFVAAGASGSLYFDPQPTGVFQIQDGSNGNPVWNLSSNSAATASMQASGALGSGIGMSISQHAATTVVTPGDFQLIPQAPNGGSGTAAQNTPGSLVVALAAPGSVGTPGGEAFLKLTRNGTPTIQMGQQPSGSNAGIWFGNVTPATSNYTFLGDGTSAFLQAPGAGAIYFVVNATPAVTVTSASMSPYVDLIGTAGDATHRFPTLYVRNGITAGTSTTGAGHSFIVTGENALVAGAAASNGYSAGPMFLQSGTGGNSGDATHIGGVGGANTLAGGQGGNGGATSGAGGQGGVSAVVGGQGGNGGGTGAGGVGAQAQLTGGTGGNGGASGNGGAGGYVVISGGAPGTGGTPGPGGDVELLGGDGLTYLLAGPNTGGVGTRNVFPFSDNTYSAGLSSLRYTNLYDIGGIAGGTHATSGNGLTMAITSESANTSGTSALNLDTGSALGSGNLGTLTLGPTNAGVVAIQHGTTATNGDFQFLPGQAANTLDTQQWQVKRRTIVYHSTAAGPTTIGSGPAADPFYCPASGSAATIRMKFNARQTATITSNTVGETMGSCWNAAGTAACAATANAVAPITNGTLCSGGAFAVTAVAGSNGCFLIQETCPTTTTSIDMTIDVEVLFN